MKTRLFHYFVLAVILLGGIFMFFSSQGNTGIQLIVGTITAISYILWGIIHHALERELHPKIVIEYILIGGIAIVLIWSMLS
ncbi:MAG: hypothetical protein ACD_48C00135G0004 [uncultured bacterium]|uniref:Uncharacterized protein n=1 Tax=Candidatus Gottesmanbacteria bacterium RIFCSPLOWO2_01_FULL_43_11b TaxID=1798392 RepID=A0A1F6AI36_9BACT|nr:MAG: hypothetical protein ACD_48C00135G0004 [uncultured bacterium]OGG24398.1 MAG: hypothetical protein A3A79_04405 [Candidatus Gottesmanbacteria bacterium RIFCSPLOWO2_01_FULL_43_11b]